MRLGLKIGDLKANSLKIDKINGCSIKRLVSQARCKRAKHQFWTLALVLPQPSYPTRAQLIIHTPIYITFCMQTHRGEEEHDVVALLLE
jgi:hypothetical protein